MKKLVWNEKEVLLSTDNGEGIYKFNDFTGYIDYCNTVCRIANADIIYRIAGVNGGRQPWNRLVNTLEINAGTIESGNAECTNFGGEFQGEKLTCKLFSGVFNGKELKAENICRAVINGGNIHCRVISHSVFNDGSLTCGTWLCGEFNNGIFEAADDSIPTAADWKEGIFNNGEFKGNWFGGKFVDGRFSGVSWVGRGKFEDIERG